MYQLLTDSGCDLDYRILQTNHVDFAPLHFAVDDHEYDDDLGENNYDFDAFYAQLKQNVMPTTTQINVGQFIDFFKPYVAQNMPILYIGFSSGLSGTYNSAVAARQMLLEQYPDAQIYVVDSLAASAGQGLMVRDAIQQRDAGLSIEALNDWLLANRLRYYHWFTVDKLDFLYHGGRVSRTSAALGTMLSIKPVMNVDQGGHLQLVRKVRTRKKSLLDIAEACFENIAADPKHLVMISTSGDTEAAQVVADHIHTNFPDTPVEITHIGPTIASHTGFGCVAVFTRGKEDRPN